MRAIFLCTAPQIATRSSAKVAREIGLGLIGTSKVKSLGVGDAVCPLQCPIHQIPMMCRLNLRLRCKLIAQASQRQAVALQQKRCSGIRLWYETYTGVILNGVLGHASALAPVLHMLVKPFP